MPAPSTVLYRHDLLGRLVAAGTASDPRAYAAWTWRGDGALASETLRAGASAAAVTRTFRHDGLGRPIAITEPALSTAISYRRDDHAASPYGDDGVTAEGVTYRAMGFPANAALPPDATVTYTRDAFGRMTAAASVERAALALAASYDGNGNLQTLAQGGPSRSYAYAAGTNRLASVSGQSYAHDAAGAVTNAAGTTLVCDPATGQMRRGTKAGETLSVLRDGRGRIALTLQGTAKRLALRDGEGTVLWEMDGTADATAHLHGATGRIGLSTGAASHAVSKDLRGSTRILYGSDGKAAAWLSYLAYGALDASASSASPAIAAIRQRYTGQDWLEPLGLYDYGARLCDPVLGRFLSPDPADETPSPYMYVGGDPVNAVDPDGSVATYFVLRGVRILILDQNRDFIGALNFVAASRAAVANPANAHALYNSWEAMLNARGPRDITNPLYIPAVDEVAPALRPARFQQLVGTLLEESNLPHVRKPDMFTNLDNDLALWLPKMGSMAKTTAVVGKHHITVSILEKNLGYPKRLTPNKVFANQAVYGKGYRAVFGRDGFTMVKVGKAPAPKVAPKGPPKGPPKVPPKAPSKAPDAPPAIGKGPVPPGPKKGGEGGDPGYRAAKRRRLE